MNSIFVLREKTLVRYRNCGRRGWMRYALPWDCKEIVRGLLKTHTQSGKFSRHRYSPKRSFLQSFSLAVSPFYPWTFHKAISWAHLRAHNWEFQHNRPFAPSSFQPLLPFTTHRCWRHHLWPTSRFFYFTLFIFIRFETRVVFSSSSPINIFLFVYIFFFFVTLKNSKEKKNLFFSSNTISLCIFIPFKKITPILSRLFSDCNQSRIRVLDKMISARAYGYRL